jgi:hypothetical protein
MARRRTILIAALALGLACKTSTEPLPAWVTALISQLENEPPANPPAFLCHPDGGFTGFFASRTNESIVWRDPRGAA